MEMSMNKKTYGNRKTILIGQDSFYIALPVLVSGTASTTIKAGEPMSGVLATRLTTKFTANTKNAVGILLHDVELDSKGDGNGTLVVAGCIDKKKVESSVLTNITAAKADTTSSLDNIIVTEGSAI